MLTYCVVERSGIDGRIYRVTTRDKLLKNDVVVKYCANFPEAAQYAATLNNPAAGI